MLGGKLAAGRPRGRAGRRRRRGLPGPPSRGRRAADRARAGRRHRAPVGGVVGDPRGRGHHAMPRRTVMGVPADPPAVADLLSPAGRAALDAEDALGPVAWDGDDSVGGLVRARLGDEVADRLVDPLLGGVYSGRADALGVRATVPALAAALDRGAPSLRAAAAAALPAAPRTGTAPGPGLRDPAQRARRPAGRARRRRPRRGAARPHGHRPGPHPGRLAGDGGRSLRGRRSTTPTRWCSPCPPRACGACSPTSPPTPPGPPRVSSWPPAPSSRSPCPPGTDLGERSGVLIGSGERRPDGTPWTIKAVTVSSVSGRTWSPTMRSCSAPRSGASATPRAQPGRRRAGGRGPRRPRRAARAGRRADRDGGRALGRGPAAVRRGPRGPGRGDRARGGRGAGARGGRGRAARRRGARLPRDR